MAAKVKQEEGGVWLRSRRTGYRHFVINGWTLCGQSATTVLFDQRKSGEACNSCLRLGYIEARKGERTTLAEVERGWVREGEC